MQPQLWPPNSPPNPVGYHVWRVLEKRVYRTCSGNINHLKTGVSNWRPAGRIRPATPSNSTRDYPPENVVH